MSVNTAHANNGVLIHSGEWILLFSDNVTMEFFGQDDMLFKGTKSGRIYLTTHRMIFNSKIHSEPMLSFSFPFVMLSDVEIEQPVFGANYIKGKVRAQPNGNWTGEAKFKLLFKAGGAIDFGQAMLRAARMAQKNMNSDAPPPYSPPSGSWYQAPPPAYQAPPGYYGWIPTHEGFSTSPPPNTVFMTENPPPYPGIGQPQPGFAAGGNPPQAGYSSNYPGYSSGPTSFGFVPPNGYAGGSPQINGYPGYPGGAPPQAGYGGYPGGAPPQAGYGGYAGGAPPQSGYPGYPGLANQNSGYPGYAGPTPAAHSTTMGFTAGPPANSKEAEAAQSAYYDPNRPQTAYVPPPAYYEPPPSYDSANKKTQ